MPFKILHNANARAVPIATCDYCGEVIEDWKKANVLFPRASKTEEQVDFKLACVGCDVEYASRPTRPHDSWMRLHDYLSWLLWNGNWGKRTATKADVRHDRLSIEVPKPIEFLA